MIVLSPSMDSESGIMLIISAESSLVAKMYTIGAMRTIPTTTMTAAYLRVTCATHAKYFFESLQIVA